ncbi:MAG TPA: patatin-like phospholipase family protein [Alphaproteobacteria bacterium]|nr:patatin-like phospholipase family protein [Alphaproteobacteria bacterium]
MVKIGLVLSGGGARGFAQIGALKVLKKNNIDMHFVSGSSIGALIGACYAHNQDPEAIAQLFLKIKSKKDVYDYAFSAKGLIKGEKLEKYITEYFTNDPKKIMKFEDLKLPLAINATDIVNQKEIVFFSGPLIPAIMASISYPGFFTTRKVNDKICIDGAAINPLPFDLIHNVDYLIMIDVSKQKVKIDENSNFKDVVLQAAFTMQNTIVEKCLENCSLPYTLIRPEVESHGVLEFDDLINLMKKGEEEAEKYIEKIKSDISRFESSGARLLKA